MQAVGGNYGQDTKEQKSQLATFEELEAKRASAGALALHIPLHTHHQRVGKTPKLDP